MLRMRMVFMVAKESDSGFRVHRLHVLTMR